MPIRVVDNNLQRAKACRIAAFQLRSLPPRGPIGHTSAKADLVTVALR